MPLFVTMMFSSYQLVNVVVINKGFFIVWCLLQTVDDSSIILTVVTIDISTLFACLEWWVLLPYLKQLESEITPCFLSEIGFNEVVLVGVVKWFYYSTKTLVLIESEY